MTSPVTPENLDFLTAQVAAGRFADNDEALNAAVALLKRQSELQSRLQQGVRQLDRGEFIELDDAGLDRYFSELTATAVGEPRRP